MPDLKIFRGSETEYQDFGEGPGSATIARLVGPDNSKTMGAYLGTFDGRSVPWTVHYDELICCLDGRFRLRTADEVVELNPGDVLWVGQGTELAYEGDAATVFMAMAPVDWRTHQAAET